MEGGLLIWRNTDEGSEEAGGEAFLVEHGGRVQELVDVEGNAAGLGFPLCAVSFSLDALIVRIRHNRIITSADRWHIAVKNH